MRVNRINYLIVGLLVLPIFFAVVDFYNSFTTEFPTSVSQYINLTPSEAIRWLILVIFFSIVSSLTFIFFSFRWFRSNRSIRSLNNGAVRKVNQFFQAIFLSIALYKTLYILNFGVLEFVLMARFGEVAIGAALYFTLIMFPLILAYDMSQNGLSWINNLSVLLIFFLNLATGYRLLLVYGLAAIVIFNWQAVTQVSKFKILVFSGIFGLLLVAYEVSRVQLEVAGATTDLRSVIDSLNRTQPLNIMQLIENKGISLQLIDLTMLVVVPVVVFLETFGIDFEGLFNTAFNLQYVSEPLFLDYLAWRGTADAEAGGFSISVVSYAFLFYQELGVIIFGLAYGLSIALGCKLLTSIIYEQRMIGTVLLVSAFLCNESVVVSIELLVFTIIFVAFLLFFAVCLQTVAKYQRKLRSPYVPRQKESHSVG